MTMSVSYIRSIFVRRKWCLRHKWRHFLLWGNKQTQTLGLCEMLGCKWSHFYEQAKKMFVLPHYGSGRKKKLHPLSTVAGLSWCTYTSEKHDAFIIFALILFVIFWLFCCRHLWSQQNISSFNFFLVFLYYFYLVAILPLLAFFFQTLRAVLYIYCSHSTWYRPQ